MLIDKNKYPITIAPRGVAPTNVRLGGTGTNPNGFAIAEFVTVYALAIYRRVASASVGGGELKGIHHSLQNFPTTRHDLHMWIE